MGKGIRIARVDDKYQARIDSARLPAGSPAVLSPVLSKEDLKVWLEQQTAPGKPLAKPIE